MEHIHYKRLLLKLSGESLAGDLSYGIDAASCNRFASAIGRLIRSGHEVAIVIGGGNICRGQQLADLGMKRSPADQIGMLGTIMNAIALGQALENQEIESEIFSAIQCPQVANLYNWRDANNALSANKAVIFAGGTGNPYFTTDTAAALRASEIGAQLLVKATKVDGIYNKDPKIHKDAILYENLTYTDALREDLKVMDGTSLALCRDNKIPILVLNMKHLENSQLPQIIQKRTIGTLVTGD